MSEGVSGKRIVGSLLCLFGAIAVVLGAAMTVTMLSGASGALDLTLKLIPPGLLIVGSVMLFVGWRTLRSGEREFVTTEEAGNVLDPSALGATQGQKVSPAGVVLGVLAIALFGWYYFGGGLEQQADRTLQDIENKVAADAVAQYGIAKRNGTAMDVCVQAGMVTAAYLQAKNEGQYQQWKQTEKDDCAKAGIQK